jgi:hypothetical protein
MNMMENKLKFSNRKKIVLGTVTLCLVFIAGIGALWQLGKTAEAAIIAPPSPPSGLVGWWRFDEGNGIIASDSSGNGRNGNVNGAMWTTGKFGDALSFRGTPPDFAKVSTSLGLSGSFSILFWTQLNVAPTSQPQYAGWMCQPNTFSIEINPNSGQVIFLPANAGSIQSNLGTGTSGWSFIAIVQNSVSRQIYVNGVLDSADSNGAALPVNGNSFFIGTGWSFGYINALIDEVQIYNRALTSTEILNDAQNGPDFSTSIPVKIPAGTTQIVTTLSWQGTGSINVTINSPTQNYTETSLSEYQKTTYSTSTGPFNMLNIKRLSLSVNALSSDQSWTIVLTYDTPNAYQITLEVEK